MQLSFLGDSIIKGVAYTATTIHPYTQLKRPFSSIYSEHTSSLEHNYGRFGGTISIGEQIVDRHIEDISRSDFTFMAFGANDCDYMWDEIAADPEGTHEPKTILDKFTDIYCNIINKVKQSGSIPVLLSLTPIDPDHYFRFVTSGLSLQERNNVWDWIGGNTYPIGLWHEMYNLRVCEIAKQTGVRHVDISTPLIQERRYQQYLCSDGIHLNPLGHERVASLLYDTNI